MTIRDQGLASLRTFRKVSSEDAHNIQTHINSIATLVSFPGPSPDIPGIFGPEPRKILTKILK